MKMKGDWKGKREERTQERRENKGSNYPGRKEEIKYTRWKREGTRNTWRKSKEKGRMNTQKEELSKTHRTQEEGNEKQEEWGKEERTQEIMKQEDGRD